MNATAHLADLLGRTLFEEIEGPHPGDRPVRTRCATAATGGIYGRSFEGKEYGASVAGCRSPDPKTTGRPPVAGGGLRPASTGPRCRARRCCSTSTNSRRGTSSSRWAAPPLTLDGQAVGVVGRHRGVTSASRCAFHSSLQDGRACCDDVVTGALGGVTWASLTAARATTRPSTRRGAPTRSGATVLGTAASEDDELVLHETGRSLLVSGSAAARERPVHLVTVSRAPRARRSGRFLDTRMRPTPGWRRVRAAPARGVEYSLEPRRDRRRMTSSWCMHNSHGPRLRDSPAHCDPLRTPAGWTGTHPWWRTTPRVRLEDVDAFAGHLVVHQRSAGLTQLRIVVAGRRRSGRRTLWARTTWSGSTDEVYTIGSGGSPELSPNRPCVWATRLVGNVPAVGLRLRRAATRSPDAVAQTARPCWATSTPTRTRSIACGPPPRDGEQVPDLAGVSSRCARTEARPVPHTALRLRRVRGLDRPLLLGGAAVPAGPRRGVRDRPRARRRRDGPPVVRRRQTRVTNPNTFTDFVACGAPPGGRPGGRRASTSVAEGGSAPAGC
jgi:oligopeptidase B